MNTKFNKILLAVFSTVFCFALTGCVKDLEEVKELDLVRCLQPTNLTAKITNGQTVTYSWDVTRDADVFLLEIAENSSFEGTPVLSQDYKPTEIPVSIYMDVDKEYWFRVKACNTEKELESKWAVCEKSVKTYAVKDNLYMEVTGRTSESVTLSWKQDNEVDRIEYTAAGATEAEVYTLTDADIAAGSATVAGLTPSTQYDIVLYFSSANRGEVNVWTLPSADGLVKVSTVAALTQGITDGANMLLTMEGSPYTIGVDVAKGLDAPKGFKIYGEGGADGSYPVIYGSINITDTFTAEDNIYVEGVELNGKEGACGFLIQHKEGATTADVPVGSVIFRNCVITGYSKGIMYEWGKSLQIGTFAFESCDIHHVNGDGTGGGDGFDIRQATVINNLRFVDNTIYTSFRTFLRADGPANIKDVVFENNTIMNLCFADNTNNAGIIAFQTTTAPTSFSLKNNLFLHMGEKATLVSGNAKYLALDALGLAASNNWYYGVPETFFNEHATAAMVVATELKADPCFNAKGGIFNIVGASEIAGKGVGASKWYSAYVEAPEDLTLNALEGAHTWDFSDAKYFSSDFNKKKVRDNLFFDVTEKKIAVVDGTLGFGAAATVTKKGVPTDGYIAFKVATPGSVILKAADPTAKGGHFVVGVGPVSGGSIAFKGGASAMADSDAPVKILVKDITEETLVYVYPSAEITLEKLAWSLDVAPVNTALTAPKPVATPAVITAGEPKDVVVSWEAVDNAASYSVVFSGKSYLVEEGLEYTIPAQMVGMLDAGSYKVEVYANPDKNDIYNTASEAGAATFAIQPKGGEEGDTEFIVKTAEELLSAIAAGKTEITLAGDTSFDIDQNLVVTAPLALKGQKGAELVGAFTLSGEEVGSFSIENVTVKDKGYGVFLGLHADGVTANEVTVRNVVLDGYAKSVIYSSNDNANIGKVSFIGIDLKNMGTGQGIFDFRKGTFGEIRIVGCTIVGGRDCVRADAACVIGVLHFLNNTFDGVTLGHGNSMLYVRASIPDYVFAGNLVLNEVKEGAATVLAKSGTKVPVIRNNFYYNVDETNFFSGSISQEVAISNNGTILTENPVKDAAGYDYTLVSGLAMSNKVGAPKWNPAYNHCDETSFVVKSADEFVSALQAGKREITLSAEGSPYTFETSTFEVPAGLHLKGEVVGGALPVFQGVFTISEAGTEDLGEVVFENVRFEGAGAGQFLTVDKITEGQEVGNARARSIIVRNCEIDGFTKSVFYAAGTATADALVFRGVTVTNHGTGQGVFDIRKGSYNNVTIENITVTGGRDLVRADAGTITAAFNFVNNTICGANLVANGNAIMYVRATPASYKFANNLFLNEVAEGKNILLSKTSGVSAPTIAKNNFFYNVDEANFFTGVLNQENTAAIVLSYDPCKDSANGDYTLTDALCLSSNIGAARWNVNAGRVTTEYTASSVEDLLNGLAAGKTAITLRYGTYDLTAVEGNEAVSSGVLMLNAPLTLKGETKAGEAPTIIGSIKFGTGMTDFVAQTLIFDGKEKALGNTFEVAESLENSRILVRNCEIKDYNKSLMYNSNSVESTIVAATFDRILVHGMGTGQGMIDLRKQLYGSLIVENSTIYDGGRDFVRCDAGVGQSVSIKNNTFASTGIDAGNGLLWVRVDVGQQYVVENNLFLNETGNTLLAKAGAKKAVMKNNWYYNVGESFFAGTYSQEEAVAGGGGVLTEDPCAASAEFNFKLVNTELRNAGVGDPRWW